MFLLALGFFLMTLSLFFAFEILLEQSQVVLMSSTVTSAILIPMLLLIGLFLYRRSAPARAVVVIKSYMMWMFGLLAVLAAVVLILNYAQVLQSPQIAYVVYLLLMAPLLAVIAKVLPDRSDT